MQSDRNTPIASEDEDTVLEAQLRAHAKLQQQEEEERRRQAQIREEEAEQLRQRVAAAKERKRQREEKERREREEREERERQEREEVERKEREDRERVEQEERERRALLAREEEILRDQEEATRREIAEVAEQRKAAAEGSIGTSGAAMSHVQVPAAGSKRRAPAKESDEIEEVDPPKKKAKTINEEKFRNREPTPEVELRREVNDTKMGTRLRPCGPCIRRGFRCPRAEKETRWACEACRNAKGGCAPPDRGDYDFRDRVGWEVPSGYERPERFPVFKRDPPVRRKKVVLEDPRQAGRALAEQTAADVRGIREELAGIRRLVERWLMREVTKKRDEEDPKGKRKKDWEGEDGEDEGSGSGSGSSGEEGEEGGAAGAAASS